MTGGCAGWRLREGRNFLDGVEVEVRRKRIRRINISVDRDGEVSVSVPARGASLREAGAFLRQKWDWVVATRAKALARIATREPPPGPEDLARLGALLDELIGFWTRLMGEDGVSWKTRRMKTLWGSCHWRDRRIVFNAELARVPRELVEYVVVHELVHLKIHDHGEAFKAAMDRHLPGWRALRVALNRREPPPPPPPIPSVPTPELRTLPSPPANSLVQAEFDF